MQPKSIRRYTAELFTNIAASIIVAIFVGIGAAVMVYLGPTWGKPLIVGGGFALITLLVLLAIKAIRLLPQVPEPTTPENIQTRARDWLDAFSLTVTKSKPLGTHFKLEIAVNGRNIGVLHPTDGESYLHFFANIAPDTDDKKALAMLNDSEKAATMVALKLELARARMGYLGFSLDGFTIFKRMPIKPDLTEATFIEGVWEMEATLNALFMVAASLNMGHQEIVKLVADKKDSEVPEFIEGPEALSKFEDGMKKLFKAPEPKIPFRPPPQVKPKEELSND